MESNISSIVALQDFNNNSASNIANVNTNHYRPTNTVIEESSVGSVKAISSKADDNGSSLSQTNLVKEITDQIVIENTTFYNVAAIRVQDTIIGTLLDIKV